MARPTSYREEYAAQAEKLCKLGATDKDLAEFFSVTISTVSLWKVQHEAFSDALKGGKEAADTRVERSLYQRAIGYSHDAVKILQNNGEPVLVPYVQHHPPETVACIFWLKNRRPDLWRDKTEVLVNRKPDDLTDDELAAIARGRGEPAPTQAPGSGKPH